jgi:molybdopterin-containing oxidoreductase family membrane subunit
MWPTAWLMLTCNVFIPLVLFWKKVRLNLTALWIISLFVNVGMWLERFVIVVQSLTRPFVPYANTATYRPGIVETGIFFGSFGWFFMFFLLFTRFLPIVAIAEVKEIMPFTKKAKGA